MRTPTAESARLMSGRPSRGMPGTKPAPPLWRPATGAPSRRTPQPLPWTSWIFSSRVISWIMRSARASGSREGFIQGCGAGLAVPAGACARARVTGLTKPRARTIQATNVGRGKLMIAVFLFVRTNQYTCGGRRASVATSQQIYNGLSRRAAADGRGRRIADEADRSRAVWIGVAGQCRAFCSAGAGGVAEEERPGHFPDHVRRLQRAAGDCDCARRLPARSVADSGDGGEPDYMWRGYVPDAAVPRETQARGRRGVAMCGRYVRRSDKQKIAEWFHADGKLPGLPMPDSDYNVAPTTHQPIIRQSQETGERELIVARWGLVPSFTRDMQEVKGLSTINARAERIATAKTWREPFRKRRCLVPADAFYEWPKAGKAPKQPYVFRLSDRNPFAFAGLWDAWQDEQGGWLRSFAIVRS